MTFELKYQVVARLLTKPSKRRRGLAMSPGVKFIVAHDTGNPGSTAVNNVAYYESTRDSVPDDQVASAHLFVDDREILECVPALTGAPEKAWHVRYAVPADNQVYGFDANDAAIGVEYCYGGHIDADAAYAKYVWVIAYACSLHDLDPRGAVTGHFFLDPKRRSDPVTGLAHSRRTYEQLLRDVVSEFVACGGVLPPSDATAGSGTVVASARANIRRGRPSTRASVHQVVPAGTPFEYVAVVNDGDAVNGNSRWLQSPDNNFLWAGAAIDRPAR
jgi:N-acetylmuramoyl-L-alanine amidase